MPIFDQGYQHWKGTLSGHAWRWLAITRQGLRGQLKSLDRPHPAVAGMDAGAGLGRLSLATVGNVRAGNRRRCWPMLRAILPPGVAADPHAYRHGGVDDRLFDVLQGRDLLHHAVGGDGRAEPDQPRPSFQRPAAVFLPAVEAAGLLPRQTGRDCRIGGRGGGAAGGRRLRAGRLLQPRPERDPRHLAVAAGQHPVRPGDRRSRPAPSCWPCRLCRGGRSTWASPGSACGSSAWRWRVYSAEFNARRSGRRRRVEANVATAPDGQNPDQATVPRRPPGPTHAW